MIFLADAHRKPKTIIISESQRRRIIGEAADETFTTNDVTMPSDKSQWNSIAFYNMNKYCEQHCGKDIGRGSSRAVYQLDDEKVIKVAIDPKGVAQNSAEVKVYSKYRGFDLFPQIYDYSPDGLWLVSEFVLPAESGDFRECLNGLSFGELCNIVDLVDPDCYPKEYNALNNDRTQKIEMAKKIPLLRELIEYIENNDVPVGDITTIENWGLAMRRGGAMPVLLDSGLTNEIWDEYY